MNAATPVITAELILDRYEIKPDFAERIAAYATLRFAGLRPADAARQAGIEQHSIRRYERWTAELRGALGLPDLSGAASSRWGIEPDRLARAARAGGHQSQHVARGIVSPGCPLCTPDGAL